MEQLNKTEKLSSMRSISWIASTIFIVLVLVATGVQANTSSGEESSLNLMKDSANEELNLSRDPKFDYNPEYLRTWLDSLRETKQNCDTYISKWNWMKNCEAVINQTEMNETLQPLIHNNADQTS